MNKSTVLRAAKCGKLHYNPMTHDWGVQKSHGYEAGDHVTAFVTELVREGVIRLVPFTDPVCYGGIKSKKAVV